MLFNSPEFVLVFLPAVVAGFFLLGARSHRPALAWLAAASLFFYAWWDWRYLGLLLGSVAFNYAGGVVLRRAGSRAGAVLALWIAADLALLGWCKYRGFFAGIGRALLGLPPGVLEVALPLGISFFTFTQIAFLVDVRRGLARESEFVHYLLFVSYFPHLLAGPIIHHAQVMPQFDRRETCRWDWDNAGTGLTLFILGLGKKMFLADHFIPMVRVPFALAEGGGTPAFGDAWAGALSYTLQLYFDFSGYSDMAVGLSLLFNIRLPLNFNSPYKAANIVDFWRRWHMTLSAFLRDYLYIPLGGNRRGPARRYLNLMATMLLGGLWHGANWTFVAWGGLHGLYLAANHGFRALRARLGWPDGRCGVPGRLAAAGLTFLAVVAAWVVFRAAGLEAAGRMLGAMAGLHGFARGGGLPWSVVAGLAIVWLLPNTQQWLRRAPAFRGERSRWPAWNPAHWAAWAALGLLLAAVLLHLGKQGGSEFLYYRF